MGLTFSANTSIFSAVYQNYDKEVKARKGKPSFGFQLVLHTKNHDLSSTHRVFIRELVIHRNYVDAIGDHMEVRIAIPLGTFLYDVYDHMDNMEVTLRVRKQMSKDTRGTPSVVVTRYKAVYLTDKNTGIPNNRFMSKDDLNQGLPVVITLQLLDRSVEALRAKTVPGGSMGNIRVPVDQFVRAIVSSESNKVLIEGMPSLNAVTAQPATVTTPLGYLTLPSFKRLIEIPDYIQEKSVGIYSAGLGCYIQKGSLDYQTHKTGFWMYSLYDPDRTVNNTVLCTVYCSDEGSKAASYPAVSRKDNSLTILAQGISGITEDKEAKVMSEGSGFRVGNAAKMLGPEAFKITKKGPVFERNKMTTEVVYKKRADGVQFAPQMGNYSNHLVLSSEVMRKQASFATVNVINLDHDFILPGKLTEIVYYGSKTVVSGTTSTVTKGSMKRKGILHELKITYSSINNNPIMDHSSTMVELISHAELKYCVGKLL